MSTQPSVSPWIWVSLLVLLGCLVALIAFLDQHSVSQTGTRHSGSSKDPDRDQPTIDFYSVLPDRKVEIAISEDHREGLINPAMNKAEGEKIILQVGAFQLIDDADRLKAELAFLGLQARIMTASIDNNTWHRVQIGPFSSASQLSRTKNRLLENHIRYLQQTMPQ